MIRWRRKSDGFVWHKHVRTTIRIRRADRRRRIEDARQLAVEGIKGAGRAGAAAGSSGLRLAGRAACSAAAALHSAFDRLVAILIAVSPAAWRRVRGASAEVLRAAWEITRIFLSTGWRALRHGAKAAGLISLRLLATSGEVLSKLALSACGPIQSPGVQPLLIIIAAVAIAAASVRFVADGVSADALFTFAAGLISALVAALPRLLGVEIGSRSYTADVPRRPAWQIQSRLRSRETLPLPSARAAGFAAAALTAVVVVVGGGWLVWQGASEFANATGSTGLFSKTISGHAEAITGDVLRIGKSEIRLEGIEAPEPQQRCSVPDNRRWSCGAAARIALARSFRGETVNCRVSGNDGTGRALGTCLADDRDLAQELVRAGLAFAKPGLFSRYGSDEEQAKAAKAGLWRGKAERPTEYRARIAEEMAAAWESAKRRAPRGCPIKGRIVSGRKYYVLPGTADYRRVRIRTRRGERWFCSEEEALAAGWTRSPGS